MTTAERCPELEKRWVGTVWQGEDTFWTVEHVRGLVDSDYKWISLCETNNFLHGRTIRLNREEDVRGTLEQKGLRLIER